jgi:hypothetical protein
MMKGAKPLLLALGATAAVAWLFARKRRREKMTKLPVSVGDAAAQQRFIAEHKAFLLEFPDLKLALETMFTEAQRRISDERADANGAPRTDEDYARATVYSLERAAYDDFAELLILAGNGMGLGATKVVRSIYERFIHALYIAKKPSEAGVFIDHGRIERGKLINRWKEVAPERLAQDFTEDELTHIQKEFKEAKARQKEERCKTCDQPKTQNEWTRVDLSRMAKEVDEQAFKAYATCYLIPTLLTHATPTGLDFRVRFTDEGPEYKLLSEPEAHTAIKKGHYLILGVLSHLNTYYALGQDAEVGKRFAAFNEMWSEDAD